VNLLRRLPTSRLLALCVAVLALVGGGAAIAAAALNAGGPVPPPKPLDRAIRAALSAREPGGLTARIRFTNRLVDSSSVQGGGPILTGAAGRLWLSRDGRLRLELQSDRGDAQVLVDPSRRAFFVYDPSSNTVYRGRLPARTGDEQAQSRHAARRDAVPALSDIDRALSKVARDATVAGPGRSSIAGRPAYTVRVSPKRRGGLVGAGALAWDAVRGVPLRVAVYAVGGSSPVLELAATDISYGAVPASAFSVSPPAGAKVVEVGRGGSPEAGNRRAGRRKRPVTGLAAVQARLPFRLAAPGRLIGLPRRQVTLLDWHGTPAALVTYGEGLGGIAVLERPARGEGRSSSQRGHGGAHSEDIRLPRVTIDGTAGTELATALGTAVTFQRDGVAYTVLGSVRPRAAEAAARGL
jgi:outer membrane lipoprotein-sorting protein